MRTDVLIVGGGLAGLNAAAELRERHPELAVTIADVGGGASSEIMGFCAPVAPGDSPALFRQDILAAGGGLNAPELASILAERALPEMRRLEAMGVAFDREADGSYAVIRSIGSTCPRVIHAGTTTGKQALRLLAAPTLPVRVVRLLKGRSGRIAGALTAEGEVIEAKAVILAGGGFAGLWKFSTWSKALRGDALVLAMEAGAELCNLACVQFEPTVTVWPEAARGFPVITTLLHEGGKLYDAAGNDLVAEGVPPKRELAIRIQRAIDAGRAFEHGGVRYDLSALDDAALQRKYPEYRQKYLTWFGSMDRAVFEVRPGAHTTLGGIRIDGSAATTVPGLFAAGEAVGNLHGRDRLGGNAGLEVFVFGRIAGASAGDYAARQTGWEEPLAEQGGEEAPPPLAAFADILDRAFTVEPKPERLREGLAELAALPPGGHAALVKRVLEAALAASGA